MSIEKAARLIGQGTRKQLERRQDTLGQWTYEINLPERHDQCGIRAREIVSVVVSGLTWSFCREI
jgi:hypothetical protein